MSERAGRKLEKERTNAGASAGRMIVSSVIATLVIPGDESRDEEGFVGCW